MGIGIWDVIVIIFCIFFPPIAVILMHFIPQVKKGFDFLLWLIITIICTIFAWLPGIIIAFLIYFGVCG
ncbi:MAG: hypothetical protein EZS28_004371 [Streblomastix strix]|uniref:YqaE/Pmp3 family membrane protein n=1 Tax=Streblomastix strix TaxID=222440 RepID=A0A5J4X0U8_9EUKA|nr:MAG: hypothetical protein EZS28_004371 [Streblomastix strix]